MIYNIMKIIDSVSMCIQIIMSVGFYNWLENHSTFSKVRKIEREGNKLLLYGVVTCTTYQLSALQLWL